MVSQNSTDSFIISHYLEYLKPSEKEKGKYYCPVCEQPNLSINKDGKKYSCFEACQGNEIAYKLRQLNGEFNKRGSSKDLLQVYKPSQASINDDSHNLTKPKTSMDVLAFLRRTYDTGRIRYNLRTRKVEIDDLEIEAKSIRPYFGDNYKIDINAELLLSCLLYLGRKQSYDPVLNYLKRIQGPAAPLDSLAIILFGCNDPLYTAYLRKWLIGCVARVFEPGCKFDEVLVLHGKQGYGKSSFFRILSNGFFSDSMGNKLEKDDLAILRRNWINEWGELDNLTARVYCGQIKAFLSRQSDQYRVPYGIDTEDEPRRSVLVGTTNRDDFLKDPTGNRRFWIIPVVQEIDLKLVEDLTESIWVAAIAAYQSGESWHLPRELWRLQEEDNQNYEAGDPWQEILEPYLETQKVGHVLIAELMQKLEDGQCKLERNKTEEMKIGDILRRLGWEKKRKLLGERQHMVWVFTKVE